MKTRWLSMVALVLLGGLVDIAAGQDLYYTKEGYAACISEQDLDMFISFAGQKDNQAMAKLIVSNRCVLLKGGIPVYRESQGFKSGFTGKVKIRPKGDTNSFWTIREALREK